MNKSATESFIADLGPDGFEHVGSAPAKATVTFECEVCEGKGTVSKTYGYSSFTRKTYVNKCKSCGGRGSFSVPKDVRDKRRAGAKASKAKSIANKISVFEDANPGLAVWLCCQGWSSFATSLAEAITKYGSLSEKQLSAAISLKAKCEATQAKRAAEKKVHSGEVDVTRIEELFADASRTLKRPKFRVERLTLSLAPANGTNAGAIYVKDDGEYAGKIVDGKFFAARGAQADTLELLIEVAKDPKEAARVYGQKYSHCSCCGKELTNPVSIELGIGPVCLSNWGL